MLNLSTLIAMVSKLTKVNVYIYERIKTVVVVIIVSMYATSQFSCMELT